MIIFNQATRESKAAHLCNMQVLDISISKKKKSGVLPPPPKKNVFLQGSREIKCVQLGLISWK